MLNIPVACDCTCHHGAHYPCSHLGGCGTTGCRIARGNSTTCVTCPTYRPDADPRIPNYPPVCDGDRALLDRHLVDIANLVADLTNDEPAQVDQRRYERFIVKKGQPVSLGETWADPLANFGGVAPIPSKADQPSVTGSRERPIPIKVNVVDLSAPARVPNPTRDPKTGAAHHQHLVPQVRTDTEPQWVTAKFDGTEIRQLVRPRQYVYDDTNRQVMVPALDPDGHLSAATTLDSWVREWRTTMFPNQSLPPATVDELVMWLRHRAPDACDRYPDMAAFAEEIRALRGALRGAAGETEPTPEPCDGVACGRCNKRGTLFRKPLDTYRAECNNCGLLYNDTEFQTLVVEQAKKERGKRTPEEITALLRRA
jgi:hypothetical protein